jgi:hypothetical protein
VREKRCTRPNLLREKLLPELFRSFPGKGRLVRRGAPSCKDEPLAQIVAILFEDGFCLRFVAVVWFSGSIMGTVDTAVELLPASQASLPKRDLFDLQVAMTARAEEGHSYDLLSSSTWIT